LKQRNKSFCIIGLTPFGQTIAVALEQQGNSVLVLDEDERLVRSVSDIATEAIVGDPMKEAVLKSAGVSGYSCVIVCFSDRINDSILLTMMLKDMGIPKVVVRAGSELECKVLHRIGADEVVFPEQDMGKKLAVTLSRGDVLEYLSFSSEHSIVEMKTPKDWVGRSLCDLDLRKKYGISVIALRNSGGLQLSIPPQRAFLAEDIVLLIGNDDNIAKL
jgi:trk system potassium uptake protein TrkA